MNRPLLILLLTLSQFPSALAQEVPSNIDAATRSGAKSILADGRIWYPKFTDDALSARQDDAAEQMEELINTENPTREQVNFLFWVRQAHSLYQVLKVERAMCRTVIDSSKEAPITSAEFPLGKTPVVAGGNSERP